MVDAARSSERLRAVADAFLRPRPESARHVVVAGSSGTLSSAWIGRSLFDAAARLGCGAELWMPDDSVHRPAAGAAPLRIVVFGEVDVASVRRLPAPLAGEGPDLFLYALRDEVPQTLRELYTFGLWSWAVSARWTRCLLPQADPQRLQRLRSQWSAIPELPKVELLAWPSSERDAGRLCQQILQSVLAASIVTGARERRAAQD